MPRRVRLARQTVTPELRIRVFLARLGDPRRVQTDRGDSLSTPRRVQPARSPVPLRSRQNTGLRNRAAFGRVLASRWREMERIPWVRRVCASCGILGPSRWILFAVFGLNKATSRVSESGVPRTFSREVRSRLPLEGMPASPFGIRGLPRRCPRLARGSSPAIRACGSPMLSGNAFPACRVGPDGRRPGIAFRSPGP